jgi:signal transduction histidine kinase
MITLEIVIISIVLFIYSLLLILAGFRLQLKNRLVSHLVLYLGLGIATTVSWLGQILVPTPPQGIWFASFTQLFLFTMILSFGALTLRFLNIKRSVWFSYWGLMLVLILAGSIFTFNIQGWNNIPIAPGVDNRLLINFAGWVVAIGASLIALSLSYYRQQSAKYLNRLRYWLIATTFLTTSGLILFINPAIFFWSGLPLIAIGSILAAYMVLSYHAPDLNLLIGRTLHYVILTGALTVVFYFGLAATVIVSRSGSLAPGNVFLWLVLLATLLAVMTRPLWRQINRLLNRIIFGRKDRDAHQVIKHYSQSVSNALDMQRLGNIVLNLMIETLGIEQGIVFVNERTNVSGVSLRPLASIGVGDLTTGYFSTNSAFLNYFRGNKNHIHQYDIDVLPEFSTLDDKEREWLSSLRMELHIPIIRHRDFVGLLCFGPRSSGTAYYEEDIDLMVALAEQSALGMDSAQLFEQLAMVNRQVGLLSEKLEGIDQDKNEFLSIASHELRTPLTQILGYSQMLLDLTEEELRNATYVKKMTEGIAKGSAQMKSVIDVMLDVTEADLGEMNLFKGPVSLVDVVEQASRPFLSALDERRIAFAKNNIENLPIIQADGTRLVQAIENLLSNAIKYSPDGGMVTIEGHITRLDGSTPAVEIVVIDRGIGIDPQYHERIFEKVFRIDDADHHSTGKTKFKGGGPGLGLALVRIIAHAHGGKVWVESQGHDEINYPGSQFHFVIPLETVMAEQDTRKQSQIETVHWRSRELKPTQD